MKNLITICTVGLLFSLGVLPTYASNTDTTLQDVTLESKEVRERGKLISSKYLCNENCIFYPETEHVNTSGEKVYQKKIDIKRSIQELNKEKESKANMDFEVIFTYDKKSFANAESSDVSTRNVCKSWKIKDVTEIRPGKTVCLVTNKYIIYRKGSIGIKDQLMEGHADVLCSPEGEIGLNTNLS